METEECLKCEYSHSVYANCGMKFLGCGHKPYHGKWVIEIKDCPKKQKEKGVINLGKSREQKRIKE